VSSSETPESRLSKDLNTPFMRQYLEIKSRFPDGILFFRMGDFYEMFLEDAEEASRILDIALTKRQNSIPMAGIPYHSTDSYISRLLSAGKKVIICEQTRSDNPKAKIMNREVVRIITPGTVIEENLLNGYRNNFLGILLFSERVNYLGLADISTSDLLYFSYPDDDLENLRANLIKFSPREILLPKEQKEKWNHYFPRGSLPFHPLVTELAESDLKVSDRKEGFREILLNPKKYEFTVLEHMLDCYLRNNFRENRFSFKEPIILKDIEYLVLDEESVTNLELVENDKNKDHTLFSVLNFCMTAVGKRILRKNILFPVRSQDILKMRWEGIEILSDTKLQSPIQKALSQGIDLERLLSRFRGGKAYPRDFLGICRTLESYRYISELLKNSHIFFQSKDAALNVAQEIPALILERIYPGELPVFLGNGPFLRDGFDPALDRAREAKNKGKDWILELEEKERSRTGISTLKIRYNKILGYYVEVTRTQSKNLPEKYFKKQTLVGSERFTTPELEEMERIILESEETIYEIEKREFEFLIQKVLESEQALRNISEDLGNVDFLLSLAVAKNEYGWKKPEISDGSDLFLRDARHPVVEKFLPLGETFVPNSIHLNTQDQAIAILTGPNMAGKSTFMRQVALNQILFQIGSYLPAKEARLPIVDRIFTRIGSGDNLTQGESTFFVEMKETARILNYMTEDSLILFDEVGRGTSTYDGLSIAWAILEYLSQREKRIKTIFATHYHELTELERANGIFNLYMDTYEKEGEVLFLKKVKRGRMKKSFGIYVAKLAGMPVQIIRRAEEILEGLESKKKEIRIRQEEPTLFPEFQPNLHKKSSTFEKIRHRLATIQIDKTTPLEALQILEELQRWSKE